MNVDAWLHLLADELRRRGVDPAPVVAEAASHLRGSGQPPLAVFGPPATYAAAVAETRTPTHAGAAPRGRGPVRLDVRGVGKRYGRRQVLTDVDLRVSAGEAVAVVGANGCGKSTLLRICAGLVRPDAGEVRVSGRLGYCPQDGGTADFLTADEHFVLVGAGHGLGRDAARRDGRAVAATLEWAADDAQARHLSGGTRQKLNLVMAGIGVPDLLLLDEPYQGFDRGTYLDFWQQVWRWRDGGRAIVVVTHLLSALDRVDAVLDLTPARRA